MDVFLFLLIHAHFLFGSILLKWAHDLVILMGVLFVLVTCMQLVGGLLFNLHLIGWQGHYIQSWLNTRYPRLRYESCFFLCAHLIETPTYKEYYVDYLNI